MPVHIAYATPDKREHTNVFAFFVTILIVPLLMFGVSIAAVIQNPEFAAVLGALE